MSVSIRFSDAEFPDGSFVVDGTGLREWTEDVSRELAEDAMLLAVGAQRANEMLAARAAAEGSAANGRPVVAGRDSSR